MPPTLDISTLMPNIAALWKKAAECKRSVVEVIVVLGFVGFFPTGMQSVQQERELLQHHLRGRERGCWVKSAASQLSEKGRREKSPPCIFFLPSLNLQKVTSGTAAAC